MRIAVIGAGALGCLFGGRLAVAGHDVWLLHYRRAYVEQLNEHGLRIESDVASRLSVSAPVPATTDAAEIGRVDLALVFVKAYQTDRALDQHAACIGPDTRVLSLQNGLGHYEQLVERVGADRALAGVTYQGAVVEEPGVIRHTADGVSTFGGEDETFASTVADALNDAEFPVERVRDPRPTIWSKQLISLPIKPLAALTRLTSGELVADDELVALMAQIIEEAEEVADARGIALRDDDPLKTVVETCEGASSHRSSMLQDVLAGRKTEIDAVNGALVELAREEGIEVPANAMVTRLVRGLERSYLAE